MLLSNVVFDVVHQPQLLPPKYLDFVEFDVFLLHYEIVHKFVVDVLLNLLGLESIQLGGQHH